MVSLIGLISYTTVAGPPKRQVACWDMYYMRSAFLATGFGLVSWFIRGADGELWHRCHDTPGCETPEDFANMFGSVQMGLEVLQQVRVSVVTAHQVRVYCFAVNGSVVVRRAFPADIFSIIYFALLSGDFTNMVV